MALIKLVLLAALAMTAFAANSLLCRMALVETDIDPASFTFWRLTSGALMLTLLVVMRNQKPLQEGNMASAIALFVYAAGFSFAYVSMTTGAGALLLFGAVQVTMISWGLFKGERMSALQWGGFLLALIGLILLLLPNAAVPQLSSALMMLAAGIAWGVYSLKGKGAKFPIEATAGNFIRATPLALVLLVIFWPGGEFHAEGMAYAVASGAIASALGYALWYSILVHIAAIKAATLQLSVPVLAVFAGWLFLDEPVTLRIILSSLAVIGGVAMVIWVKKIAN
ncbi:DMT family transporter [Alteromonas oceani]|uniref:DMT family transporter n=1 Tax=Alteromonas oceani TaxID=2071609 RepID=A0ABV7K2W7_9ALTE|nr:DMT family transporter [Alteromonas oceani]HCA77205.1 EamA family transporter [Alteromonas sp.]HCB09558.1 EamA family transporter [Alteromonas sp.]HCB17335.1 EamA family transporter [Alteromonas sp.]HCL11321.1 EamA family transporter [Alteromonas sp.]HCV18820.1 EamA family transporter [Alteromonas sp.]|tara:strand:- start:3049 stop:3894 length:846 start_codon:yes stop_codon:yes gene_type:complete